VIHWLAVAPFDIFNGDTGESAAAPLPSPSTSRSMNAHVSSRSSTSTYRWTTRFQAANSSPVYVMMPRLNTDKAVQGSSRDHMNWSAEQCGDVVQKASDSQD